MIAEAQSPFTLPVCCAARFSGTSDANEGYVQGVFLPLRSSSIGTRKTPARSACKTRSRARSNDCDPKDHSENGHTPSTGRRAEQSRAGNTCLKSWSENPIGGERRHHTVHLFHAETNGSMVSPRILAGIPHNDEARPGHAFHKLFFCSMFK